MSEEQEYKQCSFCDKKKDEVKKLIVGNQVAICNECVVLCGDLLNDDEKYNASYQSNIDNIDPIELKQHLDQYVVGQHDAKIRLSVAIANHYKRISSSAELNKANLLMIGPTGSGKTLLAKTVAQYLRVPFAIADATSITEAGYVGDDVESLIAKLLAAADGDVELAQKGIIFIDEIDKITRKSENTSITRDVSGEGVQQALLKLVEGTVCRVPPQGGRKHPGETMVEVDTTNILFISGGAFVGLEDVVQRRIQGSGMGFTTPIRKKQSVSMSQVTPDDLIKFGMIPEFVGRFPTWVGLDELTVTDLVYVLRDIKNSLVEQYQHLFELDDVTLIFEPSSLDLIAQRTIDMKTGARGLQSELERILLPHMYNLKQYQSNKIKELHIGISQVNNPTPLI